MKGLKNKDWHRADIKCALEKRGYTFARIARERGLVPDGASMVLWKPWSTLEAVVAEILGVKPQTIWPSRYDRNGKHLGTKAILAARRDRRNI